MTVKYTKSIVPSPLFYISKFKKKDNEDYLMFIHGGPGFNSKVVEHLVEHENLFSSLDHNIVLYDQRGCGRSKYFLTSSDTDTKESDKDKKVSHEDNIKDLMDIIEYLTKDKSMRIKGLIGHSYGAKLLFDFQIKYNSGIPSIFVSTADSILIPRLNNLQLDLLYLKKEKPDVYDRIIPKLSGSLASLWEITEELSPIFAKNPDRKLMNWSNLEAYEKVKDIDPEISFPVFVSVRKDLYSKEENFPVEISKLKIRYIWINGFHDFIMNGMSDAFTKKDDRKKVFYKSSHYPHIEENDLFCQTVNEFMKDV